MFEKWNEMFEHQSDWLEVSLPPGMEQRFVDRLKIIGTSKEALFEKLREREKTP